VPTETVFASASSLRLSTSEGIDSQHDAPFVKPQIPPKLHREETESQIAELELEPSVVPFTDILGALLPPDLRKEQNLKPQGMEKLGEIGKTSWMVFKQVLIVVGEVSDACPPLKASIKGLFAILDHCEVRNLLKVLEL
jgi:hypothetical protein